MRGSFDRSRLMLAEAGPARHIREGRKPRVKDDPVASPNTPWRSRWSSSCRWPGEQPGRQIRKADGGHDRSSHPRDGVCAGLPSAGTRRIKVSNWAGFLIFNLREQPVSIDSRGTLQRRLIARSVSTSMAVGWQGIGPSQANFALLERSATLAVLSTGSRIQLAFPGSSSPVVTSEHIPITNQEVVRWLSFPLLKAQNSPPKSDRGPPTYRLKGQAVQSVCHNWGRTAGQESSPEGRKKCDTAIVTHLEALRQTESSKCSITFFFPLDRKECHRDTKT